MYFYAFRRHSHYAMALLVPCAISFHLAPPSHHTIKPCSSPPSSATVWQGVLRRGNTMKHHLTTNSLATSVVLLLTMNLAFVDILWDAEWRETLPSHKHTQGRPWTDPFVMEEGMKWTIMQTCKKPTGTSCTISCLLFNWSAMLGRNCWTLAMNALMMMTDTGSYAGGALFWQWQWWRNRWRYW